MAITNMIPAIWSARLLEGLRRNLVYAQPQVVNRDYEGQIQNAGDRVYVHNFDDLTVGTYTRNSTVVSYELLDDSRKELIIDQSKFFAFRVDDLDFVQMHPKIIDAASARASTQLAETADTYVAGLYTGAAAGNTIATSQFTTTNVYSKFVDLARRMDEANIPEIGRFAVVPPWVSALLLENATFLAASKESTLNGQVGTVAGISILKSNAVVTTGTSPVIHHIMAGTPGAISYAEQIASVEALRLEGSFSDAVRGLHLYGARVLDANQLFDLRANV
jgi:N4-gp56 family major capsid protein